MPIVSSALAGLSIMTIAVGLSCVYLWKDEISHAIFLLKNLISAYLSNFPQNAASNGTNFGLKLSFITGSFFLAQGFCRTTRLNGHATHFKSHRSHSIRRGHIPLHFLEVPALLALVVGVANLIPETVISRYVYFLARFAPLLTLLEFAAAWNVFMHASSSLGVFLADSSAPVKAIGAFACFVLMGTALAGLFSIYSVMELSTLAASLLSSLITLSVVQIFTCIQVEHASITEPALLIPYVAYNILLLAWREACYSDDVASTTSSNAPSFSLTPRFLVSMAFDFISSHITDPSPQTASNLVLNAVKDTLRTVFSPVLVFHVLFQLCIMVLSRKDENESNRPSGDSSLDWVERLFCTGSWALTRRFWPLFGKSFLVLVYTIAWLDRSHPEVLTASFPADKSVPWYFDATGTWRWIAAFGTLALYGLHLLPRGNMEETNFDRNFWQQFHKT